MTTNEIAAIIGRLDELSEFVKHGSGFGSIPVSAGSVIINESVFDAYTLFDSQALGNEPAVFNSVANYSVTTTANGSFFNQFGWKGGILRQQTFATTASMFIENGTYVEGAGLFISNGILRDTYIAAGTEIELMGSAGVTNYAFGGGGQGAWGPGHLDVEPPATVSIGSGAAEFADLTTLTIHGSSTACAIVGDGGAPLCGRTLNAANLDLAVPDGGFGGFAWSPSGGAISATASPF